RDALPISPDDPIVCIRTTPNIRRLVDSLPRTVLSDTHQTNRPSTPAPFTHRKPYGALRHSFTRCLPSGILLASKISLSNPPPVWNTMLIRNTRLSPAGRAALDTSLPSCSQKMVIIL